MSEEALVYKVQDRSILLPHYKRFFVNPLLRFIPESVNPNTITHAGHLLNLAACTLLVAVAPKQGWAFIGAAILVHLYNWCDNADGAHARRTGQTSAMGEFLDHGLDMLNTTYIGYMGAIAAGATPLQWVVMAIMIPAAAAMTYWEQATTGMFHLGRLNQIESVFVLSTLLIVSAVVGTDLYDSVRLGPLTLRWVLVLFTIGTCGVGMLHGFWRVSRHGLRKLIPALPLVLFEATLLLAFATGALSPLAAVVVATAGNVFFGLRMLAVRLAKGRPQIEGTLIFGAVMLGALVVWRLHGRPVGTLTDVTYASVAGLLFGALALINAREGVRRVVSIDRARARS